MPVTRQQARDRSLTCQRSTSLGGPGITTLTPSIKLVPGKRHHTYSKLEETENSVASNHSNRCVISDSESTTAPFSTDRAGHYCPLPKKRKRNTLTYFTSSPGTRKSQEGPVHPDIEDGFCLPSPEAARQVLNLLHSFYRRPSSTVTQETDTRKSILDSLVATILSQATSNINSSRAFENLRARFSSWESALEAGPKEIENCISCGGLAQAKSLVIHNILTHLKKEHGECSLEFIHDMSTDHAKRVLCSFKGVGPKTASCVLMFALYRAEFPVDTHIRRIASRLGWTAPASTPERTYELLNPCLPNEIKYDLHVMLIEHGRKTCKANSPRCSRCPLKEICQFPTTR